MRFVWTLLFAAAACGGKGAAAPESPPVPAPSSASSAPTAAAEAAPAGSSSGAPSDGAGPSASPSPPPEPMDATLPVDLGKSVPPFSVRAVSATKGAVIVRGAVPVPDTVASQVDPTASFFAWEQVLSPGVVMAFPKQAGLDLYVALFDGEVSIKAGDIAGKQKRLWRWNAARVPGLGANIECKEPTRAILVLVPRAPGGTLGQATAAGQRADWTSRPAAVTSVELDKQPDLAWGGGAYHARLGFEDGSASLGTLSASKNAPVPANVHDHEWEILAVLSGAGTLTRTVGGQPQDTPIAPGTIASIPPGVPHAFRPAGTSPLVAVQLFSPPGPEQRFKKRAAGGQ